MTRSRWQLQPVKINEHLVACVPKLEEITFTNLGAYNENWWLFTVMENVTPEKFTMPHPELELGWNQYCADVEEGFFLQKDLHMSVFDFIVAYRME